MSIKDIIRLMRPAQWVKNIFVLLPLFLSGRVCYPDASVNAIIACLLFSLTSSAIYCINDAVDAPYDALNPHKCNRPVASGAISPRSAFGISFLLLAAVTVVLFISDSVNIRSLWIPLSCYLILNLGYSFFLKRIIVIDVLLIASFFILRIWAGAIAAGVYLTCWTIFLVALLALMLAVGKRRYELRLALKKNIVSRANLRHYSLKFLDWFAIIVGITSVIVYILWSVSPYSQEHYHNDTLIYTSLFVILGIFRYLWLLIKDNKGGSPTAILLHDRIIQAIILLWTLTVGYIIYSV
ncbi:MAG: UbiA family prenyltransferase [Muribaculaceae bacterium]|nr:UbiA family prenyltransferase [Muribaculaceae bacterium]